MKKLLQTTLLLLALLLPNVVNAHDFEVNGIYYLGYSNGNATVTFSGNIWWGWEEQDYHYTYSGDVVIPSSVTYNGKTYTVTGINDGAFYGCVFASTLSLPASIVAIGDNAFALCSKLAEIHVDALLPPDIMDKTFFEVSLEAPVFVPDGSYDAYKNHIYWGRTSGAIYG